MITDRPTAHITPTRGWLNDANGLVHWRGRHHVFHQSGPDAVAGGMKSWGHLSSDDLFNWQRHPIALEPSQAADRDGCWSGCIVDDHGVATAIYTGVVTLGDGLFKQVVCLATATDDDLLMWEKDPANPVEVDQPGFTVEAFRDPYVWNDGDQWCMVLGTGMPDGQGAVLLYRSGDLRHWRFESVLLSEDELPESALWTGAVWECPAFAVLPSGDALLLFSVFDPSSSSLHYTVAVVGSFEGTHFTPTSVRRLDHGHDFYAAALEKTDDGRVLAYGWSWEALSAEGRQQQGWAGCLTFPRELSAQEGSLTVALARELRDAGQVVTTLEMTQVSPGQPLELVIPRSARIDAALQLDRTSSVRLAFCRSPKSQEQITLDYAADTGKVLVDRSASSVLDEASGGSSTADYVLPSDGRLDLTIVIDHTIVEILLGGSVAFTERVHPQDANAEHLRIESLAMPITLLKLTVARLTRLFG